jgi:hypothetical protein
MNQLKLAWRSEAGQGRLADNAGKGLRMSRGKSGESGEGKMVDLAVTDIVCPECGSPMKEAHRSKEENALFIWYECSRDGCMGQKLHTFPTGNQFGMRQTQISAGNLQNLAAG